MIRLARLALAFLLALAPALAAAADEPSSEIVLDDDDQDARMGADEARRILESPVPSGAQEAEALVQRQRAAFALGNAPARTAALQRLVEITETRDKPSAWAVPLWRELARTGNQTAALEMGEKLSGDRRFSAVIQATIVAMLGQDYTVFGDNDSARRALSRAEDQVKRLPGGDDSAARRELDIHVNHLRAAVKQSEGDLVAAEESIRAAYDASVREVERAKQMPAGRPRDLRFDAAIRMRAGQMRRYVSVLMAEGKHVEAENLAVTGARLAQEEKTGGTMVGLWQSRVAYARVGQRRYEEAIADAQQAVSTMAAAGAAPSSDRMIFARLYELQALFGLKRWADADRLMVQMRLDAGEDRLARLLIDSPVIQSFLHLANGRREEALQRIEPSVRYRARNHGESHPSTIEAKAMRAMVFQAMSRTREALADYREVFAAIFGPDTSFADAEPAGLRGFVMPHALAAYLRLVAAAYGEGGGKVDPEMASDAFRVADRLRASVVQQALIDSSARAAASNPELVELIRREQDQRARARETMTQLVRQFAEDARATREFQERQRASRDEKAALAERERVRARDLAIKGKRDELNAAEESRRQTLHELAKRFPQYQALVNPKPPTLREAAGALRAGEALLSAFPTAEGTFVWVLAPRRDAAFHVSPLKGTEVAALVASLRKTLDPDESGGPAAKPFDFASSARLHRELVAPVSSAIEGAKVLIVAANGSLAQVPLATLVTREGAADHATAPWLVRDVAIAQVSSVAALQALRARDARSAAKPFVGFGDPAFGGYAALPPLPETRTEVLAIARVLGADAERDVFLGERATRKAAMTAPLQDRRVVAFATHGLKPRDLPGLSRPALAMAASPGGDSPLLLLDDVMTLKLNADLVVLSACNTAGADGRAEEALSGLARGFFFAGGRSVLATHWAVETLSAEQLVRRTFGHVAQGVPRAEALRRAQLELIDGKANPAFKHPFYWAPYALSGDPG